jgi:hypothetical protein
MGAHVVALEWALGREIGPKRQANHTCNTPNCVRVGEGHIYEGSVRENALDRVKAGTFNPYTFVGRRHSQESIEKMKAARKKHWDSMTPAERQLREAKRIKTRYG